MENNDNNNRIVYIKVYLYRCFYFCTTFYKVYREIDRTSEIFARFEAFAKFEGPEAIFICRNCLKNIRHYVTEDTLFF